MPRFVTAGVVEVLSSRAGLQRVALDSGRRAYVLTGVVGEVAVGDAVVVNTTAVDLGLGTGGWDVVHWNLSRSSLDLPGGGHVLKARYTSVQTDVGVAEEVAGYSAPSLDGVPVVVCTLHSQMAAVAAGFRSASPSLRLGYVMSDSAALPLALSDLVFSLRSTGLLSLTVSAGQAFGGELEAVNVLSGVEVAVGSGADAVVVAPGPGTVGTSTPHGHGGVEAASVVDLAAHAGAVPVVVVRYSTADPRDRHRGVSHHTGTVLDLCRSRAMVALPSGEPAPPEADGHEVVAVDVGDVVALLAGTGVEVTSMGRSPAEDPLFHAYAAAAGMVAGSVASRR